MAAFSLEGRLKINSMFKKNYFGFVKIVHTVCREDSNDYKCYKEHLKLREL